jgi:hypothetical protein
MQSRSVKTAKCFQKVVPFDVLKTWKKLSVTPSG